uniref:Uncharacterized protein n=1 Tax=Rhizophora mucronata TaxID=61149 RepID=A0A2P2PAW6_RHIMU
MPTLSFEALKVIDKARGLIENCRWPRISDRFYV